MVKKITADTSQKSSETPTSPQPEQTPSSESKEETPIKAEPPKEVIKEFKIEVQEPKPDKALEERKVRADDLAQRAIKIGIKTMLEKLPVSAKDKVQKRLEGKSLEYQMDYLEDVLETGAYTEAKVPATGTIPNPVPVEENKKPDGIPWWKKGENAKKYFS